ncbi:hypothetical protein J4G52_25145 [Burkholderia cenocepacia]|uniref:hypothetical protein n=1 Tax=Burkholderia cenocepacia TaxID=95486 RepID=UPI001AA1CDC6|nr:hypothetical protein [Burkholderia cenocepacia]MBO1856829.1 hypothetical protein [Burkholderia cenocepacia]
MARRKTIEVAEVVAPEAIVSMPTALVAVERQKNINAERLDIEVRELATRIGYQLPADETNPDLIQRDVAANMRRSVEACLEVGRGLMVLKKACGHGHFLPRLEVLGIDVNVAGKFMNAANKFSNSSTSMNLTKAIGSQSKLFELLVLDAPEINELAETGQTGDLNLDDIACMSVKELRAAVRETREKLDAKDEVASKNQKTIQKLQEQIARTKITPEFLAKEALEDLGKRAVQAVAHISADLRFGIDAAIATIDEQNADQHVVRQACASALENVAAALRSLAADYGIEPQMSPAAMDPSWKHVLETDGQRAS